MKMYAILYSFDYESQNMLHSMYSSEEKARAAWKVMLRSSWTGDSIQLISCDEGSDISLNDYEELEYRER